MMEKENAKKGLFSQLAGTFKPKKSTCCCHLEIEEIPDEPKDQVDMKPEKDDKHPN